MHFEWDAAKEKDNVLRHGVDFTEAQRAFADPLAIVRYDATHSTERELRWKLIGQIGKRVLLVRYTHRPNSVIRIFGAGYWRTARRTYEIQTKKEAD